MTCVVVACLSGPLTIFLYILLDRIYRPRVPKDKKNKGDTISHEDDFKSPDALGIEMNSPPTLSLPRGVRAMSTFSRTPKTPRTPRTPKMHRKGRSSVINPFTQLRTFFDDSECSVTSEATPEFDTPKTRRATYTLFPTKTPPLASISKPAPVGKIVRLPNREPEIMASPPEHLPHRFSVAERFDSPEPPTSTVLDSFPLPVQLPTCALPAIPKPAVTTTSMPPPPPIPAAVPTAPDSPSALLAQTPVVLLTSPLAQVEQAQRASQVLLLSTVYQPPAKNHKRNKSSTALAPLIIPGA